MIEIEEAVIGAGAFRLRASLRVAAGEMCALIGPSGAGKSTLLAALAGFAPVHAGVLRIAGTDLEGLPPAQRPATVLFQDHNLFPSLSVLDNVLLGVAPNRSATADERLAASRALADVGLEGFEPRRPASLSGGQRSRAALARALLRDRPALLLDEPFAALGPAQRLEMTDLARRAATERGAAVLFVTHDPSDAAHGADILAFCAQEGDGGRIDGAQETHTALKSPSPGLKAYLGR